MLTIKKIGRFIEMADAEFYRHKSLDKPNVLMLGCEDWKDLCNNFIDIFGMHSVPPLFYENPKFAGLDIEVVNKKRHISIGHRIVMESQNEGWE